MPNEVVLHVAGEGGGYTITRFEDGGAWRFAVSRRDVFSESDQRARETYGSLREALGHINAGWPRLHAVQVHPAFAEELFQLALNRLGQSAPALEQWAAARDSGGLVEDDE
jgi:hypothetical protein